MSHDTDARPEMELGDDTPSRIEVERLRPGSIFKVESAFYTVLDFTRSKSFPELVPWDYLFASHLVTGGVARFDKNLMVEPQYLKLVKI